MPIRQGSHPLAASAVRRQRVAAPYPQSVGRYPHADADIPVPSRPQIRSGRAAGRNPVSPTRSGVQTRYPSKYHRFWPTSRCGGIQAGALVPEGWLGRRRPVSGPTGIAAGTEDPGGMCRGRAAGPGTWAQSQGLNRLRLPWARLPRGLVRLPAGAGLVKLSPLHYGFTPNPLALAARLALSRAGSLKPPPTQK